ncbi:HlyD family efflux transporter periplasmic adaptor subunit [Lutibacter sp.]|uniref:HlyD family secretion protein n=1 Tax=Lutibacter sp. TaxID=1925666 RepID=UPI0025C34D11|nr:HlyD family efflux transporter periplasmic adaptor subunit [Lutibacter sp.]MCF6182530.1 HlyD family efflux transporter periplasmic adaptor subunit [Lutibacter sp.]
MKITKIIIGTLLLASTLISCNNGNDKADGYGNFEATETIVSSESNGKLLQFTVEEGQQLKQNQNVGLVDTIPLSLKKDQLIASKEIIRSKSKGVLSQISVLNAQLTTAMISKNRMVNLLKANAGTQKQLDDINGKVATLKQQINSIKTQNIAVLNELKSSNAQIAQLDDLIKKSIITNPINGTVLVKYAEPYEITSFGKPLYKIANLSSLELRVYISETQLPEIKIGQKVAVKIDTGDGTKKYDGIITWIASEAEFTPKIIQTKEERVNLVYAVKVTVKNDGSLKIGMPAEMWINTNQ